MSLPRFSAMSIAVFAFASTLAAGTITTVAEDPGTQVNIIGITGFSTFGDQMAGMTVTGNFGTSSLSCIWAATGPGAGGCSTANFSLTESGDTFSSNWNLSVFGGTTAPANLLTLTLDGIPGLTVFDRTFGGAFGTPGSAQGADATGTTTGNDGLATYVNLVAITPSAPVGDEFSVLRIDFGNGLLAGNTATWVADTDSVGLPGGVPEPGTFVLFGAGLAGIVASRLRRKH